MSEHISKAQIEVWEWKNTLHEEIKNMPIENGLRYLVAKGAQVRKELDKNKKTSSEHKLTGK
jgi:hypothetical protein